MERYVATDDNSLLRSGDHNAGVEISVLYREGSNMAHPILLCPFGHVFDVLI
jgi:hypothetical protein